MGIKIDIQPHILKEILAIIKKYLPNTTLWAFGSRVKFTSKITSDLDLVAFITKEQKTAFSLVKEAFDQADIPFRIDLHDWNEIPENFKKNIENQYIVLQEYKKEMLPNNWKKYKLGDVVEIKYGKDHKHLSIGKIPVYGSGGIMRFADKFLYDKESILIPRKGTLSNLFYLNKPFWSVDTMFYTKIKDGNNGKFLYYLLKSIDLASMNVGSAVPSLTTEILNKLEINLPNKTTQTTIANILSSIDDKIELNRQTNFTLEAIAQTLFKEMCLPKSEVLPDGWRIGKLSEVCFVQNGYAFKSKDFTDEGEIGIIKIRNISNNLVDVINTQFVSVSIIKSLDKKFKIKTGSLVIAMTGAEVGKIGITPFSEKELWLNQRVGMFVEKVKFANHFLFILLSSSEFQSILQNNSQGSAQPNISSTAIENINMTLPPIHIIEKFGEIVNPFFETILQNEKETQTLIILRDSLLPKLMKGEIAL